MPLTESDWPFQEVQSNIRVHEDPRSPADRGAHGVTRRHLTVPQRIGGLVLVAACIAGVAWYVPKIVTTDSQTFTGTVTSSGISDLNFGASGRVGRIWVHLGQQVKSGDVLASESDNPAQARVTADLATVRADRADIAGLRASAAAGSAPTAAATATQHAQLTAADAQLAKDQAQLASDRLRLLETKIVAPLSGSIVAVNGQAGETVSAAGIRDYTSQIQLSNSQPSFSLIPEGPRSGVQGGGSDSALPVIALRTSAAWQVVLFIPESSASSVRVGEPVTISVPSVHLGGIRGRIQEFSPQPLSTSAGIVYQAVVNVPTRTRITPLSGMAVSAQLGS